MRFIRFDNSSCDTCYKCLRVCPTKAVHFTSDKREINDQMCIKCGLCLRACHSGALSIRSDIYKVKAAIERKQTIIASVAPSFAGAFRPDQTKGFVSALRALGFRHVEETAVAAEEITKAYGVLLANMETPKGIASCCPSANYLVESAYPELLEWMLPVDSPMVAHGKMLKSKYGKDAYVVFIGPCLAKKAEAETYEEHIDAVLTFNEIDGWFKNEKIILEDLQVTPFDVPATKRGRAYPLGSSLLDDEVLKPLMPEVPHYRADGADSCVDLLEALKKGTLGNCCSEISICRGSCVNGPDMPVDAMNPYERQHQVREYVLSGDNATTTTGEQETTIGLSEIKRIFKRRGIRLKQPNAVTLESLLAEIGKRTPSDQLNCGACGYTTCVDKAIAAYNGLTDLHMCMPYLRQKAESFQMAVFDHSPNIICVMDEDFVIQYTNHTFEDVLNKRKIPTKGVPVYAFIENDLFGDVLATENGQISRKEAVASVDRIFIFNVLHLKQEKSILAILTDITAYEKDREELVRIKEKTIDACQKVIDRQMSVAQEIASLLGETTAETKVSLNKLRELVIWDERRRG